MPTPAPWLVAWVLGALAVLILVLVLGYLFRRRIMEHGAALVTCRWRAVPRSRPDHDDRSGRGDGRPDPGAPAEPWRRGLLRYDTTRLDLFGSGPLALRPVHRWARTSVDLGWVQAADDPDLAGLERPVVVQADVEGEAYDLAMSVDHYTALRSWVEARPPGWNSNVA